MPSVSGVLEEYLAGRATAEQLARVVATEYWSQEPGSRSREVLRPIIEVIEKAHPGIVELRASSDRPGFAVRLSERPFPKRYDAELRTAVQAVAAAPTPDSRLQTPSLLSRIVRAIRKIFSA